MTSACNVATLIQSYVTERLMRRHDASTCYETFR